ARVGGRDLLATCAGHQGDLRVILVPDRVGIAPDVESIRRGEQRLRTQSTDAGGVPRERDPVEGADRRDTCAPDTAGPQAVGAPVIVLPTLVAAEVDRRAGDRDAVVGVATGVIDPGRLESGSGCARLPPRARVAERTREGGASEGDR